MKILIVGQGIAGIALAHALQKTGVDADLAEAGLPGHSTRIAAGIINPVTGKRFVKSWRLDDFFPEARGFYQELEQTLGVQIWEERPILRLLATPEEQNDWSARCAQPDYAGLLDECSDAGPWTPFIKPGFRFGLVKNAARVHFPLLVDAYVQKATSENRCIQSPVLHQQVDSLLKHYDRVVFCEGYRATDNPYFPTLPWQLAKGEALIIRFKDPRALEISQMLKRGALMAPLGDGLFWAGGSYQWHYPDTLPSEGERAYILQRLHEMLEAPFDIVQQVAGIRPTVKDRRPFIGPSPVHDRVYIFNGLGTKGALLAPYWATQLAAHLLEGKVIDTAVLPGRGIE